MTQQVEPVVSIFIMAYNFAGYIKETLESALGQETTIPFEVIVIDDASTDGTREAIETFGGESRVRLHLHDKNQGAIRTLNEGLALARGAFISRLDGDDRLRPAFLEVAASALRNNPDVGMFYSDVSTIDQTGQLIEKRSTRVTPWKTHHNRPFKGWQYLPLLFDNCIPAPSIMARREAWQEGLPVPEEFAFADWYLNLRMARKFQVMYLPEVLADYRIHPTNMHRNFPHDRSMPVPFIPA